MYVPLAFEEGGRRWIPSGSIGYHPKFWNHVTGQMEAPPAQLVAFYRDMCRLLRAGATKASVSKRTFLITRSTQLALHEGATLGAPMTEL
jgi:hypothetical protein